MSGKKEKQRNSEALEKVLEDNEGLIGKVVNWFSNGHAERDDLIQAGRIGIWRATEWYDADKGAWSTYATSYILDEVSKANEVSGRAIRVPTNALRRIKKIRRTESTLFQDLRREPTVKEIASTMEGESAESVQFLLHNEAPALSLDQPFPERDLGNDHEDADCTILDALPSHISVEDEVELRRLRELVGEELEKAPLTPRQQQVINLRFGMRDRIPGRTFREVGEKLRITKQRAQEVEGESLQILETNTLLRRLFNEHQEIDVYSVETTPV